MGWRPRPTLIMGEGAEGRPVVLARGLPPAWRDALGAGGGPVAAAVRRFVHVAHRCSTSSHCAVASAARSLATDCSKSCAPDALTVIVNTGDDFEHRGLPICPDLDTVLYTLAGRRQRGAGMGPGRRNLAGAGGVARARGRHLVSAGRPGYRLASVSARAAISRDVADRRSPARSLSAFA